ncbi:MAG: hypothetical protein H0T79_18720 [Deltaproteobacteria bacterium]|nr:hypothetical protein [Deltaproteobacteria bacterium]
MQTATPDAPWSITYSDGSANQTELSSDAAGAVFAYLPVTPERSSTGMYSGGAPRSGRLDAHQLEALWHRVRAFEADASLQTSDRMKGTGAFWITEATGTRTFIVLRGPLLLAWDAFLAAL